MGEWSFDVEISSFNIETRNFDVEAFGFNIETLISKVSMYYQHRNIEVSMLKSKISMYFFQVSMLEWKKRDFDVGVKIEISMLEGLLSGIGTTYVSRPAMAAAAQK